MLHNQEFKVYIITTGDIMRFFVVEVIIGTMTYSLAMKIFHNVILASAGGWIGTETIKRLNAAVKVLLK
ncbi:putative membrane protein [Paenibacillus riograndensis SBR5]|uniref:Putative membrane protein n=1 Tax=Paenibacillus riograndensis SBR5 TaxID=1073571 RepID=A0A0E3WHZ1_9BACL|nr:putative membrane protein [Paenibacillus riograndensis SBR5]